MVGTVELKLAEYEKTSPISNEAQLCAALVSIIEEERKKNEKRRDYDLIDEAIEFLLELSGVDLDELASFAEGEAEEAIGLIPDRIPVYRTRVKWVIPAAALLAVLLGTLAAAHKQESPAYVFSDEMEDKVASMEPGETIETDGWEISVGGVESGDNVMLEDLMAAASEYSFMLPTGLGDGYSYKVDSIGDFSDYKLINFRVSGEDGTGDVEISTNETLGAGNTLIRCGRFDVAFFKYPDPMMSGDTIYQGCFEHGGCTYNVFASSEEFLSKIIESFEEVGK